MESRQRSRCKSQLQLPTRQSGRNCWSIAKRSRRRECCTLCWLATFSPNDILRRLALTMSSVLSHVSKVSEAGPACLPASSSETAIAQQREAHWNMTNLHEILASRHDRNKRFRSLQKASLHVTSSQMCSQSPDARGTQNQILHPLRSINI